jgi:hypothetical protein
VIHLYIAGPGDNCTYVNSDDLMPTATSAMLIDKIGTLARLTNAMIHTCVPGVPLHVAGRGASLGHHSSMNGDGSVSQGGVQSRRRCGRGEPSPDANVEGLRRSRCRCERGEPGPGTDVAALNPVPVQMWRRWPTS